MKKPQERAVAGFSTSASLFGAERSPSQAETWLVTFGDMITLVLCFVILMVSSPAIKPEADPGTQIANVLEQPSANRLGSIVLPELGANSHYKKTFVLSAAYSVKSQLNAEAKQRAQDSGWLARIRRSYRVERQSFDKQR